MAKTISNVIHDKSQRHKVVYATVAADASYATGGYPVTAAEFGMTQILDVSLSTVGVGTHFAVFDYTNSKIMVFVAAGTQVANAADINTLRFKIRVTGY